MDNNHADALLNMELEARLQERVRELLLNDRELVLALASKLSLNRSFLSACKANFEHFQRNEWRP